MYDFSNTSIPTEHDQQVNEIEQQKYWNAKLAIFEGPYAPKRLVYLVGTITEKNKMVLLGTFSWSL